MPPHPIAHTSLFFRYNVLPMMKKKGVKAKFFSTAHTSCRKSASKVLYNPMMNKKGVRAKFFYPCSLCSAGMMRWNSCSKLGVSTPVPMAALISATVQKRPSSISTGSKSKPVASEMV